MNLAPSHQPVARTEVARRLFRLLANAAADAPAVAVVEGGTLSGKTHLAALTAAEARRRSFRVAEVDARQSTLLFYIVDRLTRQLGVRTEGQTDDLARLHGLRLACQRAGAGRAGVAIIIDNADLLAPGDAEVLHDLMVSPPIGAFFCLLTVGTSSAARRTTNDLIGALSLPRVRPEWLRLGPLGDEEVAQIAEERLAPGLMTYRFVRDVCALSSGIAGHAVQILETVEALPPQDRAHVMTGSEVVEQAIRPGALVDDLTAPIVDLGAAVLHIARALAVLRGPSTAESVATLLRLPVPDVEATFGMLEDHGLVTMRVTPTGDALAWFSVPLIGVAIRRATPLLLGRLLNKTAAETREREGITNDTPRYLVAQTLAGALPLTPPRMDRVVAEAQALVTRSRYAAARRVLEATIARGSADPASPLPPRAFTVLSEALSRSGAATEASRVLDAAASAEQPVGSAAEAMIRQARTAVALGREAIATGVLEAGLRREDLDRPTRARLMLELARLLILNRDPVRGRALCNEAYDLARSIPDGRMTTEADISLHVSYLYAGQSQRALAHCRRALISAHHPSVPGGTRARALSAVGHAILDATSITRGLHWLQRAHRTAERAEDLATVSWTSQLLAEGSIEAAQWDDAASWTARAVRLDGSLHRDRSLGRSRAIDARLRALRGSPDSAWADEAQFPRPADWADGPLTSGSVCLAHVEHALLAGRPRPAYALIREMLSHLSALARARVVTVELLPAAVEAARAMGDVEAARAATSEIADLAEAMGDELRIARPLLNLARAQVAAMTGEWQDVALDALAAGTEMTRLGYHWRAANAYALAGEAHVHLKQPQAEELLTRAFRTYRAIGAQPRLTATRELLREIGSRTPRTRDASRILTARQWEIAGLAADGRTDAAIAAALSISRRTVTTHMHHVLGRLDLESRHQLAEWFREHPEPRA
ncbi:MAG: LuxR C-terminal-related transcriptional regulator [Chloroflexi bacterium]|nr:LuxR C-terminal-related transcriptional regulator [Chloroflexota bacterium]